MAVLKFGTKASTLEMLKPRLKSATIKPLVRFSVEEWRQCAEKVISRISIMFGSATLVVRSSSLNEDQVESSNAGKFHSELNVDGAIQTNIRNAVERVILSYGVSTEDDEVFVQEQILSIKLSGVAFTRESTSLAPYYVVNYDDVTESSSSVTSGHGKELKTYIRSRFSEHAPHDRNLRQIIGCLAELEHLFENDALDVEFAIDKDEVLYVLQVRPIAQKRVGNDREFQEILRRIGQRITELTSPHPGLQGDRGIFSVMTDWNPAEMIGTRPRPLALSLYKELITDSTWAYQRNNYGYRNLRSFPLLHAFGGAPYIDVRASFNSFIPSELDDTLSAKLVNYYCDRLVSSPQDHDKVEFRIVFSCYYLNLSQKIKALLDFNFSELELDRIKFALLTLTNNIIRQQNGHYKRDLEKVEVLEERYKSVMKSSMPALDKIYWLLEDCKRYGTLPFAGLARAGFIAVQMLRSITEMNILSDEEVHLFMSSLNTVANQLTKDTQRYFRGELTKEAMIERYGHLRPGTYDIRSPRYDDSFDDYFRQQGPTETEHAQFSLSPSQRERLSLMLIENGLLISVDELLAFLQEAIEGREYSKFVFTRSLSQIFRLIEELGNEYCLSLEDLSYLRIGTLTQAYSDLSATPLNEILSSEISNNRIAHEAIEHLLLPQLIVGPKDVYDFHLGEAEPNFITHKRVTEIVVLEEDLLHADLKNKIVFIRGADPGYDWMFSREIAGLVTMYGGTNSHMAIRCAELNIPAAIGCGEKNYANWSRSLMLDLDCANRKVLVVDGRCFEDSR